MEHALNVEVAKLYDVDTSLFLHNMKHFILHNSKDETLIIDGNFWMPSTLSSFTKVFPYWSSRQMQRIINNCVDYGLIIKGNHNKSLLDRTSWYALTPKAKSLYLDLSLINVMEKNNGSC